MQIILDTVASPIKLGGCRILIRSLGRRSILQASRCDSWRLMATRATATALSARMSHNFRCCFKILPERGRQMSLSWSGNVAFGSGNVAFSSSNRFRKTAKSSKMHSGKKNVSFAPKGAFGPNSTNNAYLGGNQECIYACICIYIYMFYTMNI